MCCFSRGERSGGVDFVINIWIWMFPATQWFPNASGQFQYYMFFFAHFLESNLNPHVSGQRREFCVFWYYAGEKSDNGQSLDIWRESSVSDGSYAMKTQFQEKVSQKSLNVIKTYFFCIRAIGPVLTWFSIRFFDDSLRRWIVCLFITNGFQSNRKSLIT